jgi:hypothetical protein
MGTSPEEVEEDPMATMRTQKKQRQAMMRAQEKGGASNFFTLL